MDLHSELLFGKLGNIIGFSFGIFLLIIFIPMIGWLVLSIIQWRQHKEGIAFKWWTITVAILCVLGVIILVFAKIFSGAAYNVASKVNIYIPTSVKVLENDFNIAIDGNGSYTVIQFNESEMEAFINSAQEKGWQSGNVVPYSLLNVPVGFDPLSGKHYALPRHIQHGYYYSSVTGPSTSLTRKVYFLDIPARTLYVYSYHGQGP